MPRPPRGVYVDGDRITRAGYRDREPRGSEVFHVFTEPRGRALLQDVDDIEDLRWNGTTVVRRRQAEIDARVRDETIAADDAAFEGEQTRAMFLVLFDEINRLRTGAGFQPLTIQQAKNAYREKLNR